MMVIPHVRFQQLVHLHTTNQNQVMRAGLPEIPQPGTQEYREYFEKYGHIINNYGMMIVTVTQNGYQLDSRVISVN